VALDNVADFHTDAPHFSTQLLDLFRACISYRRSSAKGRDDSH